MTKKELSRPLPRGVPPIPKKPVEEVKEELASAAEAGKPHVDPRASVLQELIVEVASRRIEALKLYRPLPMQQEFHESNAKERIIYGANRSGKTVTTCVEVAKAVTGQDPHDRYPKENGTIYIVGKDSRELGNVIYKKLFRAGAFKIIRDAETKQWRAFRPTEDAARIKEAKPAPPLIPPRFVKSISWELKKENLPKVIILHNGWEMHFFSGNAKPPHGAAITMALFDEEVPDKDWYSEIAARLVDENGWFLWSATPQKGTAQLYELYLRAQEEKKKPVAERSIDSFFVQITNNEYLTEQQKADFARKLSPEEYRVRFLGEFPQGSWLVFPEYSRLIHDVKFFEIPRDWTRYIAVDPGRQICAALFMAIPPPEHGDLAYIYDELYIANCSAELFGRSMVHKTNGQNFEAFIIDHTESRKQETGSGLTIEDQYSSALRARKISSVRTGSGFAWGAAEPKAGVEAMRQWLLTREDNTIKLRVMREKVPNFIEEIEHYRYKKIRTTDVFKGSIISDIPEDRGRCHLMACARYMIQYGPVWVPPKVRRQEGGEVWKAAQKIKNKGLGKSLNLGPGKIMVGA